MNATSIADQSALQAIDCIFCGPGAAAPVVIHENGFDGRKCQDCGLIFISPRPSLAQIIDLYGHDDAHVPAQSHLAASFSKRLYARHSLSLLRRHKTAGDVLEIGAGGGFFLDEARKVGFNPFAIEFNGKQSEHMRATLGIPCVGKPLADDPFPGQSFDVIYHCDVVSHFYQPLDEFQAFHKALKRDGLLMFETGNLGDVHPRHLRLFRRFQYPDHLFFFSTENISHLLEKAGFELIATYRYSILVDIWIDRVRAKARRVARRLLGSDGQPRAQAASVVAPAASGRPASVHGSALVRLIKMADQYANYLVRYRLGRWLPKGDRPQSMIVVARKKHGGPEA